MNHRAYGIVAGGMSNGVGEIRKVGILAALCLSVACAKFGAPAPHVPGPMASALLAFAAQQGVPPEEVARTWTAIEGIADKVAARQPTPGEDAVDNMNAVVFKQLGFSREVDKSGPEFLLLPSVVGHQRGGCVGLGALYLALGERLGIPMAGILVPGHFFVRAVDAATKTRGRNVELLRAGEAMPDDWYARKYGAAPTPTPTSAPTPTPTLASTSASPYMRPLDVSEVIAVHWFNVGNQRRDAADLNGASDAYARAAAEFPAFAEARASLGTIRHLQGDLRAAAQSYVAAASARPDLPGLAHNLAVLELERNRQPSIDAIDTTFITAPVPVAPPSAAATENESGKSPRRPSP